MSKPERSPKAPAAGGKTAPAKPGAGIPANKATASRQEVRQELRRTQVPRQSQRPAERSNQRRSGKH